MRIALRRLDLLVPQDVLHLIKRAPRIDQQVGKRMPQVVHAQIRQPHPVAAFGPRIKEATKRLSGPGVGQTATAVAHSGQVGPPR